MYSQQGIPSCLLPNHLEEIRKYLIVQKEELLRERLRQQDPPVADPFPEITDAINNVESLKAIQQIIEDYWYSLEEFQ